MDEATKTRDNLNLYLAFLDMEARYIRRLLGYDWPDGVFTPISGRINRLYGGDVNAGLLARSRQILTDLEV